MREQLEYETSPIKRLLSALAFVAAAVIATSAFLWATSHGVLPWSGTDDNSESDTSANSRYPIHRDIIATVFWVGEEANATNDFIHNVSSYWVTDWVGAYGGIDDPDSRCGYLPCGFTPKENPFYFALPYGERNGNKLRPTSELKVIPWYEESRKNGTHLLKNRWIKVTHDGRTAYAQWQDVGPFNEDDHAYVFGGEQPAEPRAGIDLSPATAQYLDIEGRGAVDWQFMDAVDVPSGPWTQMITRSGPRH